MKTNRTSLLFASLLALGVVAAAPAMAQSTDTASTHTSAHTPPEKSSQPGTDTWVTTKVKSELLTTKGVHASQISVETKNGVVWLSGAVTTQAEKTRAIEKAGAVKHVRKVDATHLKVTGKS